MKYMKARYYLIFFLSILFNLSNVSGQVFRASTYNVCLSDAVVLTDTAIPPIGRTTVKWTWDLGNTTSIETFVNRLEYTYLTLNSTGYNAKLIRQYSDGTLDTLTVAQPIRVVNKPIANFTIDRMNTCPYVDISFTPTESLGDAVITSRMLYLGDGTSTPFNALIVRKYNLPGVYQPKYVLTDANGCRDSIEKSVNITLLQKPKIALEGFACRDSITTYLNLTPNKSLPQYQWTWETVDVSGAAPNQLIRSSPEDFKNRWENAGVVRVMLIREDLTNKCKDSSEALNHLVDNIATFDITPSVDTSICLGDELLYTIKSTGTISFTNFTWGTKISGDTLVSFKPLNSVTYRVASQTPNCPPAYTDIKINVVQPIDAKIEVTPTEIVLGRSVEAKVVASGIWDSVRWIPSNIFLNPTADSTSAAPLTSQYLKANIYYSLGKNICVEKDSVLVTVNEACTKEDITMPTAFTPSLAENNIFYPRGYPLDNIVEFRVYNRWGNTVYAASNIDANDKNVGWNGKLNNSGEELVPGVYYYTIVAECSNKTVLNFQGEIVLIR